MGEKERIPILAVTASAWGQVEEQCRQAGIDAYISKPFRREELLVGLQRWIKPWSRSQVEAKTKTQRPGQDRRLSGGPGARQRETWQARQTKTIAMNESMEMAH